MNRRLWLVVSIVGLAFAAASHGTEALALARNAASSIDLSHLTSRLDMSWVLPIGLSCLAAVLFARGRRGRGTVSWKETTEPEELHELISIRRREIDRLRSEGIAVNEIARRTGIGQDAIRAGKR